MYLSSFYGFNQENDKFYNKLKASTFPLYSKNLDSIDSLPSIIKSNLEGFFKNSLGEFSIGMNYESGLIIDQESFFNEHPYNYRRDWVIPRYQFIYILNSPELKIKDYVLEIRMDIYGQITYANWPLSRFESKSKFRKLDEIEKFAIKKAKEKDIFNKNYKVKFVYNENYDRLCWQFSFYDYYKNYGTNYNVIEIDCIQLFVVEEYGLTYHAIP